MYRYQKVCLELSGPDKKMRMESPTDIQQPQTYQLLWNNDSNIVLKSPNLILCLNV